MKEKLRRLPDSELAVMQALWRADAPLTRPELDAALTHREWAATTVVALLARLEGKGFIAREKQGRGYLYRALVTQDAYLAAESRTLLGNAVWRQAAQFYRSPARCRRADAQRHRGTGGLPGKGKAG